MEVSISVEKLWKSPSEQSGSEQKQTKSDYFSRDFHGSHCYWRTEKWYPDLQQYTFQTTFIPLQILQAHAIKRYREELKLKAYMYDQQRREDGIVVTPENASLDTPKFLQDMYNVILDDWEDAPDTREWKQALHVLADQLHEAVTECKDGAFVKLAIRSPKDSALTNQKTWDYVQEKISQSVIPSGTVEAANETVQVINDATLIALRVYSGEEALRLFIESERVYSDLIAYELFLEPDDVFDMNMAVREWCSWVNPNWEFRAVIVNCEMTALTIYNELYFDQRIVNRKDEIQEMIFNTWNKVKDNIHQNVTNYVIDFALSEDLEHIAIIELNDSPPVAGTGLFHYGVLEDRSLLQYGPFSFRVLQEPLKNATASYTIDASSDIKKKIVSLPAAIRAHADSCRPMVEKEDDKCTLL